MKLIRALIFALACCLSSPLVLADEAWDAFAQGTEAFNRQDYNAAYPAFLKAAELGKSNAQFIVGTLTKLGYGTQQSPEKARVWYRKSAEQGNVMAQVELAKMLELGTGGAKDLRQAYYWYDKAAEKYDSDGIAGKERLLEDGGSAGAQYTRGLQYQSGFGGMPKDEAKARYWFELAAAQGYRDAQSQTNTYKERDSRAAAEYQARQAAEQQRQATASRGPSYWEMQVEADRQKLQQMNAGYNRSQNNTKPWDDNLRCHSTTEAGCRR